jgi:hypothetical protein
MQTPFALLHFSCIASPSPPIYNIVQNRDSQIECVFHAQTGPSTRPKYCRLWKGVTCDTIYQIISLNLTVLDIQVPANATLSISRMVDVLQPLSPFMVSLDAAAMHLAGTLPDNLANFYNLEKLNLSGNEGLTGSLPSIWSALTALRTLDVSGTGISGGLPPSWASLQELQAFQAADCNGLLGQLPLEWGILRSLEELVVTNSQLSGMLPAWTDVGALHAAGASVLSIAECAESDVSPASVKQRKPVVQYTSGQIKPQALAAAANRAATALRTALAAPQGTRIMPLRIINLSGNKLFGQLVPGWSLFEQLQVSCHGCHACLLQCIKQQL